MIKLEKGIKHRGCNGLLEITVFASSELGSDSISELIACDLPSDLHKEMHTAEIGEVRIWWE